MIASKRWEAEDIHSVVDRSLSERVVNRVQDGTEGVGQKERLSYGAAMADADG